MGDWVSTNTFRLANKARSLVLVPRQDHTVVSYIPLQLTLLLPDVFDFALSRIVHLCLFWELNMVCAAKSQHTIKAMVGAWLPSQIKLLNLHRQNALQANREKHEAMQTTYFLISGLMPYLGLMRL